ncbi:hypothetical protein J3F83DRAFT_133608 [Trichoderma novae-zelandiae]
MVSGIAYVYFCIEGRMTSSPLLLLMRSAFLFSLLKICFKVITDFALYIVLHTYLAPLMDCILLMISRGQRACFEIVVCYSP